MPKNKLILAPLSVAIAVFVFGFAVLFGSQVNAGNVQYTADGNVTLSGSGLTVTIKSGSQADTIAVGTTSFDVTVSAPDTLVVESTNRYTLTNTGSYATQCFSNVSQLSIVPSGTQTVTITPSATTCGTATSSSGGTGQASSGGGGAPAPAPTPTPITPPTGQTTTTITPSGGSVAIANSEGGGVTVQVPNGAVSGNTNFTAVSSAASGTPSVLIPATLSTVANRFYEVMASTPTDGAITSFGQPLNLQFTYTDAQIANFNESGLQVHYWDGVKWVALPSTVDTATNVITATVTHLTIFAIFGTKTAVAVTPTSTPTPTPAVTLLRQIGDPKVYVIENGKKKWIKTAQEFTAAGYNWSQIQDVSALEIAQYPDITVVEVTLIRLIGDPKVYIVENGKRRWIKTAAEFVKAGYDWNAITDVSSGELAKYPEVTVAVNIKITALKLNVRSLPSLSGKILTRVSKGAVYPIISEQPSWIKIKLADGTEGWVYASYTVKQ